jgi:hypothetical protein
VKNDILALKFKTDFGGFGFSVQIISKNEKITPEAIYLRRISPRTRFDTASLSCSSNIGLAKRHFRTPSFTKNDLPNFLHSKEKAQRKLAAIRQPEFLPRLCSEWRS